MLDMVIPEELPHMTMVVSVSASQNASSTLLTVQNKLSKRLGYATGGGAIVRNESWSEPMNVAEYAISRFVFDKAPGWDGVRSAHVVSVIKYPKLGNLQRMSQDEFTYTSGSKLGKDRFSFLIESENGLKGIFIYEVDIVKDEELLAGQGGVGNRVKFSDQYFDAGYTFANLTGAAVGETTGEGANATITLDTDAAGHGWYEGGLFSFGALSLDANFNSAQEGTGSPRIKYGAGSDVEYGMTAEKDRGFNDISNWLPTSNPNEWVARAGTDAAGKMDMLSVLLHEYGHALGIDHSADSHDYMATTLTPGMRRLPEINGVRLH